MFLLPEAYLSPIVPHIRSLDRLTFFVRHMQNLMKGYIARERGIVVLSKGGTAFPGTGV